MPMGINDIQNFKMPAPISMSEALAKRVLEKVRDLQANLKADQELLVYYETASGEITKKQVLTRL